MTEPQAGEPALTYSKPDTRAGHDPGGKWELIGPTDCPIMWRRTVASGRLGKLLVHRFMPNAADKDCHDHPRDFLTIVLRGGYDDVNPYGFVDRLRAPAIRYRRAEHAHITRVHDDGALTVYIMLGNVRRAWGFFRDGRWYRWKDYERKFGLNWRCDE